MGRSRKAKLGFASDVGGTLLLTLVGLAMAPLILHYISVEVYGFWLTAVSVIAYLGLVDAGLGLALARTIAAYAGREDVRRVNQVISTAFFSFCAGGLIFALIGLLIAPRVPDWFSIPTENAPDVVRAFRVAIVAGACALPCSIFSGINNGFQRMAFDNLSRTVVALTSLALSVLLLYLNWGLMALAVSTLFQVFATAGLQAIGVLRFQRGLRVSLSYCNRVDLKELVTFGGYFQLARIANTVSLNSDNIVISSILGAHAVTPYVFTAKLATLFSVSLASKLPIAVMPGMAQLYENQNFSRLRTTFCQLTSFAVRLGVCSATVCALGNRDFVILWVGNSQFGGLALSSMFCIWGLQDVFFRGAAGVIFASGRLRGFGFASIIEAALNVSLSLVLVQKYGLVGVALGTVVAKTLTTGWFVPVTICRSINLQLSRYLIDGLIKPAFRCLLGVSVVTVIFIGIGQGYEPSWWRLVLLGGAVFGTNILAFEGIQFARDPMAAMRHMAPHWRKLWNR
ncbi:oligosaccharide flippase family protein [bacterium]|nr:oligosaccharide flippase family protein [bacterium]